MINFSALDWIKNIQLRQLHFNSKDKQIKNCLMVKMAKGSGQMVRFFVA